MGKLLIKEGSDPSVVAMFYRAVAQTVLLFVSETWVLSALMKIKVEGTHTSFLRQITGNQAQGNADRRWVTPRA